MPPKSNWHNKQNKRLNQVVGSAITMAEVKDRFKVHVKEGEAEVGEMNWLNQELKLILAK
jgi:hypothetical protein